MITLASIEHCSGCTACKAACPKQAIAMMADHEGFLRPQIDANKCVQCHACERACPVLHPGEPDLAPTCYAARTKDDSLRLASSSGGIFTELARPILAEDGIVFGCVWEKPTLVAIHTKAETEEELAAMRGSKYVQSDLRDTLKEAKAALQQGRKVLFSGTPCQIAGLNRFLGKRYDNLLTVEIICHGVPSPAVFEKYKQELGNPTTVNFKDKSESWHNPTFTWTSQTGQVSHETFYGTPYALAFLRDFCLRPSCYNCQAKCGKSGADITIADFWGIEKVCPKLDDDRGTSAVLLHTPKGQAFWSMMQTVEHSSVSFEDVTHKNPSYLRPVQVPKMRNFFMKRFEKAHSLKTLVNRCIHGPWILWMMRRCLGKAKHILKKVLGL